MGPDDVIITLGEKGAMLNSGGIQMVEGFTVKSVDAVGAGDVFCGVLAVALAEGMDKIESVRFACAAAAISVTRPGAQPSFPTRKEIEKFLKKGNKK